MWTKIVGEEQTRFIKVGDKIFQVTRPMLGASPTDLKEISNSLGKCFEVMEFSDRRLQLKPVPLDPHDISATLYGVFNWPVDRSALTDGTWYIELKYKYYVVKGEPLSAYELREHTDDFNLMFTGQSLKFGPNSYKITEMPTMDAQTRVYTVKLTQV